jgi:ATP dependent DNA ligase domain
MECALVSELPEGPAWTYEVKLDGYRAIGVKGSETILYSRNHRNFNKRFPQIAEALRDLPPDTVIDGEVVALDESGRPDFHRLQHFTAEASRIHYFVLFGCDRVLSPQGFGRKYQIAMPVRESAGDWTRSMGRDSRRREDEEMRLGFFHVRLVFRTTDWNARCALTTPRNGAI